MVLFVMVDMEYIWGIAKVKYDEDRELVGLAQKLSLSITK